MFVSPYCLRVKVSDNVNNVGRAFPEFVERFVLRLSLCS